MLVNILPVVSLVPAKTPLPHVPDGSGSALDSGSAVDSGSAIDPEFSLVPKHATQITFHWAKHIMHKYVIELTKYIPYHM